MIKSLRVISPYRLHGKNYLGRLWRLSFQNPSGFYFLSLPASILKASILSHHRRMRSCNLNLDNDSDLWDTPFSTEQVAEVLLQQRQQAETQILQCHGAIHSDWTKSNHTAAMFPWSLSKQLCVCVSGEKTVPFGFELLTSKMAFIFNLLKERTAIWVISLSHSKISCFKRVSEQQFQEKMYSAFYIFYIYSLVYKRKIILP